MAELAGCILGGFPILISAIENYGAAAEVLSDFWKYQRQYKKFKRKLQLEQLLFESNLQKLLRQIDPDNSGFQELLDNPSCPLWRQPELAERLRERLPERLHDNYIGIIGDMNEVMEKLKSKFGADNFEVKQDPGQLNLGSTFAKPKLSKLLKRWAQSPEVENSYETQTTPDRIMRWDETFRIVLFHAQKIKFALGRATREKLLVELRKYNNSLTKLLEIDETKAKLTRKTNSTSALQKFWEHANDLFDLLANIWCDSCKGLHQAHILLKHNTGPINSHPMGFGVTISFSDNSCLSNRLQRWQNMDIRLMQENRRRSTMQLTSRNNVSTDSVPMEKRLCLNRSSSAISKLTSGRDSSSALIPEHPNFFVIKHLCIDLSIMRPDEDRRIGCLQGDEHHYVIRDPTIRPEAPKPISLEDLLPTLSREKRYLLAFIIASSHLQLYSSPWLNVPWSIKDINFLNPSAVHQPYLSRKLFNSHPEISPKDNGVTSLGVVILELCFGITLKKYIEKENLQMPASEMSTIVTAHQWCIENAQGEAGPEYANAIEWCLMSRNRWRQSVNERWKEELFEKVVEPLRRCHELISGEPQ